MSGTNGNGTTYTPTELALARRVLTLNAGLSFTRAQLQRMTSMEVDGRRNIARDCGWPEAPTAEDYQGLFDRFSLARRVAELYPRAAFQSPPGVYESEDANAVTPFEKAWDGLGAMLRGEQSWFRQEEGSPVHSYLCDALVQARIGCYGVLFIGFGDGAESLEIEVKPKTGMRILYLRPIPETRAVITTWETDATSPRYGMPAAYQLTLGDPNAFSGGGANGLADVNVHWTRCVHVAETDLYHSPAMQPVLDDLLDLRKIYGASGEGYWQAGLPLTAWSIAQELLGENVDIDRGAMKDVIEQMRQGLKRDGLFDGVTPQNLASTLPNPAPHILARIQSICASLRVPVRKLLGSERGELASSQDEGDWVGQVRDYRSNVAIPRAVIPFVDRLIWAGVLPVPKTGYVAGWPEPESMAPKDKAAVALVRTQALSAYVVSKSEVVIGPLDWLTREMGYSEEEATAILERSQEIRDKAEADAAKAAQASQDALQAQAGQTPPEAPQKPHGAIPEPSLNAFCPTGAGGGVDPSCGKGDGSAADEQHMNAVAMVYRDLRDSQKSDHALLHKTASELSEAFGNGPITRTQYVLAVKALREEGMKIPPVANTFCPTGPGGGVDPTCSPGGSGGGDARAPSSSHFDSPPKDHAAALTLIRSSAAFRQFAGDRSGGMRGPQDAFQGVLTKELGGDGKPKVTGSAGVDAAIKAGGIEGFRGLTDPKFVEDFRSGAMFHGKGIYGNGTYLAVSSRGAKDDALPGGKPAAFDESKGRVGADVGSRAYAAGVAAMFAGPNGAAARMVIDPKARVGDYNHIEAGQKAFLKDIDKQIADKAGFFGGIFAGKAVKAELSELRAVKDLYGNDKGIGRYALTMGYHAYTHPEVGYAVVLDRSKVIVEKGDYYHKGNVTANTQGGIDMMTPEDSRRCAAVLSSPYFLTPEYSDADLANRDTFEARLARDAELESRCEKLSSAIKAAPSIDALSPDMKALLLEAEKALED